VTRAEPAGATPVGLLLRLAAIVYDGLLALAIVFLGTLPLVILNAGEAIPAHTWWYRLYLVLLVGGYFVFFWVRGETLGMKSWRIMIVSTSGGAVGVRQAVIRAGAAVLSWLPCGAGFLWSLLDREGLAWHDRLSGTKLVRSVKRR
jgi:uncharacterized RDD family membrane protein YckC